VDRVLVADQGEKARVVDDFYEHLLGSVPECGFSLDLKYLGVQEHDLSKLEAPFSEEEEEVWSVIRSQEPGRAPRPAGFM
jgi:hypothetical protein